MRVAITILLIAILTPVAAWAADPLDFKVDRLFEKPTVSSREIYKIPIEVKLLDMDKSANWFKVKIVFSLGLIKFEYTGWTSIPIGKFLAKRSAKEQLALK